MKVLTILIKDPDSEDHYGYQVKLEGYGDSATIVISLLSLDQKILYYKETYNFFNHIIANAFTNEFTVGDAKKFAKRFRKNIRFFNPDGTEL